VTTNNHQKNSKSNSSSVGAINIPKLDFSKLKNANPPLAADQSKVLKTQLVASKPNYDLEDTDD
jgi:hypothetical protein